MGKNHINLLARRGQEGPGGARRGQEGPGGSGLELYDIWYNIIEYSIIVSIFPIKRYQIGSYHELPRVSQSHDSLGKMMRYGCLDDFGMNMIEPMLRKSDSGAVRETRIGPPLSSWAGWLFCEATHYQIGDPWLKEFTNLATHFGFWGWEWHGIFHMQPYATTRNPHTTCIVVISLCILNAQRILALGMKWNWGLLDKMGRMIRMQVPPILWPPVSFRSWGDTDEASKFRPDSQCISVLRWVMMSWRWWGFWGSKGGLWMFKWFKCQSNPVAGLTSLRLPDTSGYLGKPWRDDRDGASQIKIPLVSQPTWRHMTTSSWMKSGGVFGWMSPNVHAKKKIKPIMCTHINHIDLSLPPAETIWFSRAFYT